MVRSALLLIAALVVSLPVALVGTLLALPLWSAIETEFGIEAVGHSGPASWCYWATYTFSIAALTLVGRRLARRRGASREGAR